MATALVVMGLIGLFFLLMSVRLIFIKGGNFKGTCASQSPYLRKEDGSCGYCGKKGNECDKEGSLVNKLMSKF